MSREIFGPIHSEVADTLQSLGFAYNLKRDYSEALLELYPNLLMRYSIHERDAKHPKIAEAMFRIGKVY